MAPSAQRQAWPTSGGRPWKGQPVTLDEMLALLPDNETGEISAADLRAIVTDLHGLASVVPPATIDTVANVFSYQFAAIGTAAPAAGRLTVNAWSMGATNVRINETSDDGEVLTFGVLDVATTATLTITTGASGSKMVATVTGDSVDNGVNRDIPISVVSLVGPVPVTGARLTLALRIPLP